MCPEPFEALGVLRGDGQRFRLQFPLREITTRWLDTGDRVVGGWLWTLCPGGDIEPFRRESNGREAFAYRESVGRRRFRPGTPLRPGYRAR
jgi:hypothetical protein